MADTGVIKAHHDTNEGNCNVITAANAETLVGCNMVSLGANVSKTHDPAGRMPSGPDGEVRYGETIKVKEVRVNDDGTIRLRFHHNRWVSLNAHNGRVLFIHEHVEHAKDHESHHTTKVEAAAPTPAAAPAGSGGGGGHHDHGAEEVYTATYVKRMPHVGDHYVCVSQATVTIDKECESHPVPGIDGEVQPGERIEVKGVTTLEDGTVRIMLHADCWVSVHAHSGLLLFRPDHADDAHLKAKPFTFDITKTQIKRAEAAVAVAPDITGTMITRAAAMPVPDVPDITGTMIARATEGMSISDLE